MTIYKQERVYTHPVALADVPTTCRVQKSNPDTCAFEAVVTTARIICQRFVTQELMLILPLGKRGISGSRRQITPDMMGIKYLGARGQSLRMEKGNQLKRLKLNLRSFAEPQAIVSLLKICERY